MRDTKRFRLKSPSVSRAASFQWSQEARKQPMEVSRACLLDLEPFA